jgi:hypothetical protein
MKLMIGSTSVKMKDGLYCLNDLHKASGGEKKNGPSYWAALPQTKSFLETTSISVVKLEGRGGGTYAEKKAVYSYAMWISPQFQSHVIDAYDALVTGQLEDAKREATRNTARLEAPFMTKAVQFTRQSQGKKSSHFHFSNEFNLINQIALGATAKQYKIANGIGPNEHIRDTLTVLEIACIEHLQRANTTLIEIGLDYQKRKCELSKIYTQRHARGLIDEVARLEH